jgi:4-phytase/acid phosphatase
LLTKNGCGDAAHAYIWADTDQRTMETGRAFADGAFPGCSTPVHSLPVGAIDPLFHWSQASKKLSSGATKPSGNHTPLPDDLEVDPQEKHLIVEIQRVVLGCDPGQDCVPAHRPSIALLGEAPAQTETKEKNEADGPLAIAASFAEDFLLEYAEGMPGDQVGWGHVDEAALGRFLDLHTRYFALSHGTPKTASVEASNMLFHIARTLQQHINDQPAPGAIGPVDSKVVFLVGHDTNIAGIATLLGLHWNLDGRADDTPPGVELAFELWQNDRGAYSVRLAVSLQTLHQLRELRDLTLDSPPQRAEIALPACKEDGNACPWVAFQSAIDTAIDSNFISVSSVN